MLSLLDRDDKWHTACVAAFDRARLPLGTTGAVLAELFHLLGPCKRDREVAWQLLRSDAITVIALSNAVLPDLQSLMKRYHDRPMDFADATLVYAGSKLKLADVLTIDYDDFETYRMAGRRKFRILPERGAATR